MKNGVADSVTSDSHDTIGHGLCCSHAQAKFAKDNQFDTVWFFTVGKYRKLYKCNYSCALSCDVLVGWSDIINFPICTRDWVARLPFPIQVTHICHEIDTDRKKMAIKR